MNEKTFYQKLRKALPSILLQRIESPLTNQGIPDLIYKSEKCGGFIELKYLKGLPVREKTKVRIKISDAQRAWLTRWQRKGSVVWLIVGIGSEILVFNRFSNIGELNSDELYREAFMVMDWKSIGFMKGLLEDGY